MMISNEEGSWRNVIVDEVCQVREAIDEEVGHDFEKLAERACQVGEEYRRTHKSKVAESPPPHPSVRGG